MKTISVNPQDPHIDYPWDNIHECENKVVKPMIACVPLTKKA